MTPEQGTPRGEASSRYDWDDHEDPAAPARAALPLPSTGTSPHPTPDPAPHDTPGPFGAPTFIFDDDSDEEQGVADGEAPRRRGLLPAWAILAIVVVQAVALVSAVGLVVGGLERVLAPEAEPSAAPARSAPAQSPTPTPEKTPGTVTDAQGEEVGDGIGSYDRPATVGEHTLTWQVWTGGDLEVTALAVDPAGELPDAGGDVLQEGYRLVVVEYEVRYRGGGQLAPAEELWLTGESDRTYFPDVAEGLLPDPMVQVPPLADGETARFHSAFLVPENELDTFRLGVETFSGQVLYLAAG